MSRSPERTITWHSQNVNGNQVMRCHDT